jgi:signal peptidase I
MKKEQGTGIFFYGALTIMLLAVLSFRIYWGQTYEGVIVDGVSMNQTLYNGEKLLMRKASAGEKAKRGDIIVVYVGDYPECADVASDYLIKRLIAIEGDRVKCQDGQLSICYAGETDYVQLEEPYAYYSSSQAKLNYDFSEYVVGKGEIFFLGDNRNNSRDSRYQEPQGSHLDCLYKEKDIYGIVPNWALDHQKILEKIFFRESACSGVREKG